MTSNGNLRKENNGLVPSVDRAVQILQLFNSGDETYGVSELARRLDLNKSTLHGILNTLSHHHLLERDEKTKTYRLGQGLLTLSRRVNEHEAMRTAAHAAVIQLARDIEETVLIGIFQDEHVVIVDREEAPHDLKISASLGQRLPFNAGAFGYIFGAAIANGELTRLAKKRGLRAFTRATITRLIDYRRVLDETRTRGYAIDREEFLEGVRALAVPINDASCRVVAALCVVGLTGRMPDARLDNLAREAGRAADEISRQLGAHEYPMWDGIG